MWNWRLFIFPLKVRSPNLFWAPEREAFSCNIMIQLVYRTTRLCFSGCRESLGNFTESRIKQEGALWRYSSGVLNQESMDPLQPMYECQEHDKPLKLLTHLSVDVYLRRAVTSSRPRTA